MTERIFWGFTTIQVWKSDQASGQSPDLTRAELLKMADEATAVMVKRFAEQTFAALNKTHFSEKP